MKPVCIVDLPGTGNYAIVSPGRIVYALDATEAELAEVVNEEENFKDNANNNHETSDVDSLAIITTHDCNLRCIYCYALGGESQEIVPLDDAKTVIKHIRKSSTAKHFELYLVGGGEPLLPFELVVELVHWLEKRYSTVGINVVSNGTFDYHVLDWLIEKKASMRISFDCVMQEQQRPREDGALSSEPVQSNIRSLMKAGLNPIVQCIITQDGVTTMCDTVDLLIELGAQTVKFEPALPTEISRGDNTLKPNALEYADRLLEVIGYVAGKSIDFKIDTGFFGEPGTGFYCGMPTDNMTLTPSGHLTACVEVARPTDPFAQNVMFGEIVGSKIKINTGLQNDLSVMHTDTQLGGCAKCNLRLICRGGCPMANLWESGLPIKKSNYTCAIEHRLLPKLLLDIVEVPGVADVVLDHETKIC